MLSSIYTAAYVISDPLRHVRVLVSGVSDVSRAVEGADYVTGEDDEAPLELRHLKYVKVALPSTPRFEASHAFKYVPVTNVVDPKTVVLGGTFDHLHQGHLILLSMAALLAEEKLICGVYDFANTPQRLLKKANHEFMESLDARIKAVEEFLRLFKPNLQYRIEGILDDFGPTRNEPDMQVIVASGETEQGCLAVNKLRKENGLCELDIYLIGVVANPELEGKGSENFADKISSSFLRRYLSEQAEKTPK
ncbi:Nucleotidylyl transferase [Rhizoclosmatium globosum]|uniref:Nucleotidylyl transferase n=1 Tax=Rhizoclosmatium globosum TaxID=329046 RepID=A0A1Y2BR59_9FUNG|nr:Nucleotidylyl transferase [Rhizoclosmatium globosum]|eukprot:ORY37231.1 Nucleotidylyl transferase [Rhizoclosmatium globosum]